MGQGRACLIILGGSSQLGLELAKTVVENGTSVISVDLAPPSDPELTQLGVTYISHDLAQDFSIELLKERIGDASSVSMVFVVSARKQVSDSSTFFKAWEVQVKSLEDWSAKFLEVLSSLKVDGHFVLISSINSRLVSHSNPRYGALKAAAESIISSYAIRANVLGRGSFLTLRLGYVENFETPASSDWATSQARVAKKLVGMKNLVTWKDVAMVLQKLLSESLGPLNGSLMHADHGVHLIEQTHAKFKGENL
jgi:NAD(P)-dependent dehydrogenase (short-subunit alcohol dehydrogenase family)